MQPLVPLVLFIISRFISIENPWQTYVDLECVVPMSD